VCLGIALTKLSKLGLSHSDQSPGLWIGPALSWGLRFLAWGKIRCQTLPDFDSFERIFKSVVAGEYAPKLGAKKILELDEVNKVMVVKGRSSSEVEAFLTRASGALRNFFPQGASFTSSDDNKEGKDLFEESTKTHVELKSGTSMTDANSGLKIVSWATRDLEGQISQIMSEGMLERRQLALSDASDASIDASKSATMDSLFDHLKSIVKIGPATPELTHYLKLVAAGITNKKGIVDSFGKKKSTNFPLLLEASWDVGLKLYTKAFLPNEEIIVTKIERTKDRAHLLAEGVDSKRRAKIYPNFKNSWTSPEGRKVPASYWVKNACFHVWVN